MNDIENVQPLPHKHRKYFFRTLFVAFVLIVPALIFYATGYRYDFASEDQAIMVVGGMYISAPADQVEIYVNDELNDNTRLFRSASYIQNLIAGQHQVHVQGVDLQTWVKRLPVYPHIVTEASAFNMPSVPQTRLVSEYQTTTGDAVVLPDTIVSSSTFFTFSSSTNNILFASTTATTSLSANPEFVFIETLFASSSETAALLAKQKLDSASFEFSSALVPASTTLATSTRISRDVVLYESEEDVFVQYVGSDQDIPYYYCVTYTDATTTAMQYGDHVVEALHTQLASTTDFTSDHSDQQLCRSTIRIDRSWQSIRWFDFVPGSTDLILLQLNDGLYVTEVDDRSWQNTQQLYPGSDIQVVVDGGRIFVKDRGFYFEVFTEITQ